MHVNLLVLCSFRFLFLSHHVLSRINCLDFLVLFIFCRQIQCFDQATCYSLAFLVPGVVMILALCKISILNKITKIKQTFYFCSVSKLACVGRLYFICQTTQRESRSFQKQAMLAIA